MTVRRILEAEPLRLFMGFLLALVLFAAPAGAQGRTFYVQSDGDDLANGLSPERAWKTLDRVNRAELAGGDRVLFRCGDIC